MGQAVCNTVLSKEKSSNVAKVSHSCSASLAATLPHISYGCELDSASGAVNFIYVTNVKNNQKAMISYLLLNCKFTTLLILTILCSAVFLPMCSAESYPDWIEHEKHKYTNKVVIRVPVHHRDSIDALARKYNMRNLGPVGSLEDYHELEPLFHARGRRSLSIASLKRDHRVAWFDHQKAVRRVKRDYLSDKNSIRPKPDTRLPWADPLYSKQWYLHGGGVGGYDMNVKKAWKMGYTGRGIVVSILDDGIQRNHPDLEENYDPLASKDINGRDSDPMPQDNGDNKHGTRCAGEVASVAGNKWCGVGVAYHSKIGGVRMLDGTVTDSVEAGSLSLNPQHIDIYSASWGPEDDGRTFDGPGPLAKEAFYKGITKSLMGVARACVIFLEFCAKPAALLLAIYVTRQLKRIFSRLGCGFASVQLNSTKKGE